MVECTITRCTRSQNSDSVVIRGYLISSSVYSILPRFFERIAVKQLSEYCESTSLDETYQSAYRRGLSTETALLNDLLINMDNQIILLLVLLDMSAAFDTIPHGRFLDRLQHIFGLSGSALEGFTSYFQDRYQRSLIKKTMTNLYQLEIGLPQGSGAGPFGNKSCTNPIGSSFKHYSSA